MLIANLTDRQDIQVQLSSWEKDYSALYGIEPEILDFSGTEDLLKIARIRHLDVVFVCLPGPEGFLHARRVREELKDSKVLFVAENSEYAVKGIHCHFTDYLVLPLNFKAFVRAMKLAGVGA